jgi:selenide,water dikinase
MGATPLTALNVVGFPIESFDKRILAQILKGGWDKAREADVTIVGGHSVKDPEIKYGLAVTAIADPHKIIKNSTAREGDKLILTKALGTGILTTALKNGKLSAESLQSITETMKRLNRDASQIMLEYNASACTDITGFGFLGHLYEMMIGSNRTAIIYSQEIPIFQEVVTFIQKKMLPGGLKDNFNFIEFFTDISKTCDNRLIQILCDPQTSGGLLFSIAPNRAKDCLRKLQQVGISDATIVGEVIESAEKPIKVI